MSSPNMTFRNLGDESSAGSFIPEVLPWVLDAGNPYLEWFFGGPRAARNAVERWMGRSSSELAIGRTTILVNGRRAVGGFLALRGATLRTCRAADALAATTEAGPKGKDALLAKLRSSQGLFQPVAPDEMYLSKMGILAGHRGSGLGRTLIEGFLDSGRTAGFSRFRLDVFAGNPTAIGLYRAFGFEVISAGEVPDTDLRYLAMSLETTPE